METSLRRTWAEIDLNALEHNYHQLRSVIGAHTKFMGIVKADAYGHGAVQISRELERLGVDYLAVSSLDEAQELRENGIQSPILILGYTPPLMTGRLLEYNITQTVTSEEIAIQYNHAAQANGGILKVHIKADTGMSRLGFLIAPTCLERSVNEIYRSCQLPHLLAEGIFTHFAASDEDDEKSEEYTRKQFASFIAVLEALQKNGQYFQIKHCANSGAVARYPEMYLDIVRPGIELYGVGIDAERLNLKPVMSLKSNVSTIKDVDAGTDISYGRTFTTQNKSRIGVIPIGYADGLMRGLSNQLNVHTPDGMAPIRGRICMDMTMIDLSYLPDIVEGTEVEIFGQQQRVDNVAKLLGTISYELVCAVSKRVPRLYIKDQVMIERVLRILS